MASWLARVAAALAAAGAWAAAVGAEPATCPADVATTCGSRPNIVLIVSDDTGYWDLGAYLGGAARGMPTPNLDKLASEGMIFTDFYAQPSCTPGRAAMQTGRIPNRSGMTTVAFEGQGGGLPPAEWTVASLLKEAQYKTFFAGKWHLGEAEESLPTSHGYDQMENVFLYHLNTYGHPLPELYPQVPEDVRAQLKAETKGIFRGPPTVETTPTSEMDVAFLEALDEATEQAAVAYIAQQQAGQPFFMSVNWAANHQPNLPHPSFVGASQVGSKYADKLVEMDARTGAVLDALEAQGLAEGTLVVFTVDNGAWQDVHPDSGMTPFRGTKGTVREGGSRVPAIFRWPGRIPAGARDGNITGGLDLMATFAQLAGVALPEVDREGEPIIFDSFDMAPLLFGEGGPWARDWWAFFTEDELAPGAIRVREWKAVFNLRGDNGATAGTEPPAAELGWRGQRKYVATVPNLYNLWEDPMERYDVFMTSGRENTWVTNFVNERVAELVQTYVDYPPRPPQSATYRGPLTIDRFRALYALGEQLGYVGAGGARSAASAYTAPTAATGGGAAKKAKKAKKAKRA